MAVITISRQFGAGGRTLGNMVAQKMNYQFLDDQIIQEIAQHTKVTRDTVISMEKDAGGAISRMISSLLSRDYMDRLTGEGKGYLDEDVYVQALYEVMAKLASEGDVVLIGRGGQYILENHEGAFHVLLVANFEDRVKFMQKHYKLTESRAKSIVASAEKKRANLYRKFGREDYNDPIHYHLVLNMSRISLERGVGLVCSLVGN
ncbi:MAG: cytidylate kinase-like family protein [Desulfobacteraceae bacterium]|nr:MAG: cytidylate kinase-like family protein [Desulfobacteraceae bacterium]